MSGADVTAVVVGALLVVAGIALTAVQLLRNSSQEMARRGVDVDTEPFKLALTTTFPGLVLVGFGVVLLAVVAVAD